MITANAAMLVLKAQREAQQRAEEEAFRAALMAKFAEDDRLEQLNAQRRRLKVRMGLPCMCVRACARACVCPHGVSGLPLPLPCCMHCCRLRSTSVPWTSW